MIVRVIEAYSVIRMIRYVSVMTFDIMGYVRPVIQTVTITLPIHYCISSTTYTITIYIVIISNENYRILEIIVNYLKYIYIILATTIVFVLNVVYTTISFTKRGSKYENG